MSIEKVLIAYPRGECGGVETSRRIFEEELTKGPVYGYHQLVHNRCIIQYLESKGGKFVDDIEEIPYRSTVVFSAHGVSPDIWEKARKRKLRIKDATCGLIRRIHNEVKEFALSGYDIVLIGHNGHDEVVGTIGEAPDKIWIVENAEDVRKLPDFGGKLAYVTQTTLNVDETNSLISVLRQRYTHIKDPSKECICPATKNRQDAIKILATFYPKPHSILIFGSANSSNTNRLLQLAKSYGIDSHRLDAIDEIETKLFEDKNVIGISSGASVPETVVQEAIRFFIQKLGVPSEFIYDFRDLNLCTTNY